jgi:hypothetical protein
VENHRKQALVMDQPVAALLTDLKARGLLEETLVLWTTEFGRTPITQGVKGRGRDHHQHGFTIWMAGAGFETRVRLRRHRRDRYDAVEHPVDFKTCSDRVAPAGLRPHAAHLSSHNGVRIAALTDVHGEGHRGNSGVKTYSTQG